MEAEEIVEHLIAAGCDVNVRAPRLRETALEAAVRACNLGLIHRLIDAGADPVLLPLMIPGDRYSALAAAEVRGEREIVALIRKLVTDVDPADEDGPRLTPEQKRVQALVREAASGHVEGVRELMGSDGVPIDGIDVHGRTALAAATEAGHHQLMRELIAAGADVNHVNGVEGHPRSTPLICAAVSPAAHRDATLRLLLEAGAEIDLPGADGRTALMHAVERDVGFFGRTGEPAISIRTLIAAGADLDLRDPYGLTAWMRAMSLADAINIAEISEQYRGIAGLLEQAGASTAGAPDLELLRLAAGRIPLPPRGTLAVALLSKKTAMAKTKKGERLRELLSQGANPDARRFDGTTALILAVRSGHAEMVTGLVEAGCDLNARERLTRGSTALIEAVMSGHHDLVGILIEAGVDQSLRRDPDRVTTTPGALAVARGHHRIAGLLGEPKRPFKRPFPSLLMPEG